MFKLAVLGPVITRGLGLGRQCAGCYRRQSQRHQPPCFGFAAGCLGYEPMTAPVDASDHEVRLGAKNA